MASTSNNNGRIVIMLDKVDKSTLTKVQNELQVKFTSSAELSSKVKINDVLKTDKGILLKNLGILVVEDIPIAQMKQAASKNSKIVHWEAERTFTKAVSAAAQINKIKKKIEGLQNDIEKLEQLLRTPQKPEEKPSPKTNLPCTWGLEKMNISTSQFTGKGVDICILDTGFYLSHPDFKNRNIRGKSFIPNEPWEYDGDGHGTHCTGTAAGYISQAEGLRYGIAYESNILIGKVLSDTGSGNTSALLDAIDWALEKKVHVISMSLTSQVEIGEKPSQIFEQIGRKALEQNTLIIAAAGNDSNRPNIPKPVGCPANAESIMAVGAVDEQYAIARFSNAGINAATGGKIDLVGPGVGIFSSYSNNAKDKKLYKTMNGTSMATPHIAGLAALYREAFPQITAQDLWKKLEHDALKIKDMLVRDFGKGFGKFQKN